MDKDTIYRQAAIDFVDSETVSTNPEYFKSSGKFIEFMDDADIASFGKWQWANGFNTALAATTIQLKKLPSAQPEVTEETVIEYCRKRCLIILPNDYYLKLLSTQLEQTIGRLTSEVHDRLMDETGGKAVNKNEHWGRGADNDE